MLGRGVPGTAPSRAWLGSTKLASCEQPRVHCAYPGYGANPPRNRIQLSHHPVVPSHARQRRSRYSPSRAWLGFTKLASCEQPRVRCAYPGYGANPPRNRIQLSHRPVEPSHARHRRSRYSPSRAWLGSTKLASCEQLRGRCACPGNGACQKKRQHQSAAAFASTTRATYYKM